MEEFMNSAEKIVASLLIGRGFVVSASDSENTNGVDIVAIKNNEYYLIEVKSAIYSMRSCRVNAVGKSGKFCTHIAIVTKNKNVIFNTMSDHLKLCSKDGTRGVTNLVRIYDEIL